MTISAVPTENPYYYYLEAQLAQSRGDNENTTGYLKRAVALDPSSLQLNQELVQALMHQKQFAEALDAVNEALVLKPEAVSLLLLKGELTHEVDGPQAAIPIYRRILTFDPKQEEVYFSLGNIYREIEQPEQALQVYQQMTTTFPDSIPGYFYQGHLYAVQKQYDLAEKAFLKVLTLNPNLDAVELELARLYKAQKKMGQAEDRYLKVIEQNPNQLVAQIQLGLLYHQTGQPDKAGQLFDRLATVTGNDPRLISTIAKEFLEPGYFDETLIVVNHLLERKPKESGLNYLAGLAYADKKEPKQAILHFEKVTAKHPFFVNATIQTGILLREQGDIVAAIEHLEKAVSQKSDDAKLYRYLGYYLEQQKAYPEAIEALNSGLEVDSENVDLLYRLGIVQDKMGQWEASIATMQKILVFDPNNSSALNFIGYSYADNGVRLDEAEVLIKRALAQKPNDGFILDSLGWVYYKKGDYGKALQTMLLSVNQISDDPTILEHLGDVYVKMQQPQKAVEYYHQALKYDPSDPASVQQKINALQ